MVDDTTNPQPNENKTNEASTETNTQRTFPWLYQINDEINALIMTKFMEYGSNHINPVEFRLLSRECKDLLDSNRNPEAASKFYQQGPLMQRCMKIWWANEDPVKFNNGVLTYTPPFQDYYTSPKGGIAFYLNFDDLDKTNGIFTLPEDLSKFRVMKNIHEFLKTGGDNAGKNLYLFVQYSDAQKAVSLMEQSHPFVRVVKNWDISQAAVGVFIRHGSDKVEEMGFYHLTTASSAILHRMKSLYELVKMSAKDAVLGNWGRRLYAYGGGEGCKFSFWAPIVIKTPVYDHLNEISWISSSQ